MNKRPATAILLGPLLASLLQPHALYARDGSTPPARDEISRPADPAVPPFECEARVGYDRDLVLPGYLLPTSAGARTCIPFTSTAAHAPAGYKGDYYVDEFSDAKLRERWQACKADKACYDRVYKQVMARHPPNKEYNDADPRHRFLLGKVEEKGGDTDLKTVRRPAFFAAAPYNEPIAAADASTYIVEFTAPAEPYERLHKNLSDDIRLRGWYIRGAGVDDGKGGKRRALIVMSGGGGDRVTAVDDPADTLYSIDAKTGESVLNNYPSKTTGAKGQAAWRRVQHSLHQAGFDVLAFDRRGIGVSGGYSDTNTLQQGRDLLAILASLRTGKGMRALTPNGDLQQGRAAASALRGGTPDTGLPVLLLGNSRGTMATSWAMTMNFDKDCSYDLPAIACKPAAGDRTIKGAILVAEFSAGAGHVPAQTSAVDDGRGPGKDRGLFIGGIEVEHNIVFFPSSATLAGISKWPSAFFARGLWCYASGLEGTIDSYRRVKGLKDLVVVRAPHPYETWPEQEQKRMQERMIAYAQAVVLGRSEIPGRRTWSNMKELVATSGDVWEPSTHPTVKP